MRVPSVLKKAQGFLTFSGPYRRRFGTLAGLRLAVSLRDWARPIGQTYSIHVPGHRSRIFLRAGMSDAAVFEQVWVDQELAFPMPSAPQLIVDAGAHIGLSSVFFAHRFPAARVLALEVDSNNFDLLVRNTRAYRSILPLKVGLWSRRAKLRISNPGARSWAFQVEETTGDVPGTVDAVGVTDLVEEYGRIGLLKMDIEGSEREVFSSGAEHWIRNVDQMAVELHDRLHEGCRQALDRATEGAGFREFSQGEYVILQRV